MSVELDISKLTVKDFSLQIFSAICVHLKNTTQEKIKEIVKIEVQNHLVSALKAMKKGENEIQDKVSRIMQNQAGKDLIKKIYDMVLDMKLKSFLLMDPNEDDLIEADEIMILSLEERAELEAIPIDQPRKHYNSLDEKFVLAKRKESDDKEKSSTHKG